MAKVAAITKYKLDDYEPKSNGRPPIWNEPDEMQQDFLDYIAFCERSNKLPTITGFACFKNIHRDVYYEYKNHKNNRFIDVIKMIEQYIEEAASQRLIDPNNRNATGTIFYLKNKMNWTDKQEIVTNTENTINILNLSQSDIIESILQLTANTDKH